MMEIAPKTEKRIAFRWKQWIPWATHHIHAQGESTDKFLTIIELLHHSRVVTCLALGLNWGTIRRRKLDNPLVSDEVFQHAVYLASVSGYIGMKHGVHRTKEEKCHQLLRKK
jgi:hypothetical protein